MSLVKWIAIGLLLLPLAEIAVFALVAAAIGVLEAFILLLATSAAGVILIRRLGSGRSIRLRTADGRFGVTSAHLNAGDLAHAAGAILLAIPGFLTDIAGVILLIPPARRWIAATVLADWERRRRDPSVVDLEPEEWQRERDPTLPRPGGEEPR
jgi:UPF0716 protein FxsA